jgi:hypothetical protein
MLQELTRDGITSWPCLMTPVAYQAYVTFNDNKAREGRFHTVVNKAV